MKNGNKFSSPFNGESPNGMALRLGRRAKAGSTPVSPITLTAVGKTAAENSIADIILLQGNA